MGLYLNMEEEDQLQLFNIYKKCDVQGIMDLIGLHYESLCAIPLRYSSSIDEDPSKVVSDTLEVLTKKKRRQKKEYNINSTVESFLTKTVNNQCFQEMRNNKTHRNRYQSFEQTELVISLIENKDILKESINKYLGFSESRMNEINLICDTGNIKGQFKELLILLFDGFSNKEIAERLNITMTNVTTQKARLMEKLRPIKDQLKKRYEEE